MTDDDLSINDDVPQQFMRDDGTLDHGKLLSSWKAGQRKIHELSGGHESDPPKGRPRQQFDQQMLTNLYSSWQEYGSLSDDIYEDLNKTYRMSREFVDSHLMPMVDGAVANFRNAVQESVGGRDEYLTMAEWAKSSLPPEERRAFNAQIRQTGDINAARAAVKNLHARYQVETGQVQSPMPGQPSEFAGERRPKAGQQPAALPYETPQELTNALNDPKYGVDAAYRKEVDARLAVTDMWEPGQLNSKN